MVDSVFINSGRGCINCSGIWASRHTQGDRRGPRRADRPGRSRCRRRTPRPAWPRSPCPARPTPSGTIDRSRPEGSRRHRHDRQVRPAAGQEGALRLPAADGHPLRVAGARPSPRRSTCSRSPRSSSARRRRCSRRSARRWSARRSPTTRSSSGQLIDATHIDRLNIGPLPTIKLELAAAARGEHRRLPVPRPGLPDADKERSGMPALA